MGTGEAKRQSRALAVLRDRLAFLSPSCTAIGGERGVVVHGLLAQLHQCARRIEDDKKPLPGTVEVAKRFYLRLHHFWACDAHSPATCQPALRWVCERVLDDGHAFLVECANRPRDEVDRELTALFRSDLQILQELAHAPWWEWLRLSDVRQVDSENPGQREKHEGSFSGSGLRKREELLLSLVNSKHWPELIEEIAAYKHADSYADTEPVYRLGRRGEELLIPIERFAHFPLDWLQGNSVRIDIVEQNTKRLLEGHPANNVLVWGPRGCGKSSLIRGLISKYFDRGLRGVEINPDAYDRIPDLFAALRSRKQSYVGVLDNISMSTRDAEVHSLARVLDGCLEAKPDNLVFYATSNFKDLVDRQGERVEGLGPLQMEMSEDQQSLVNQGLRPEFYDPQQRERLDEQRALDDRFALKVFLDLPAKEAYERMVVFYARQAGVEMEEEELLAAFNIWRMRHNHDLVGGRTARDFAVDIAPLGNGR